MMDRLVANNLSAVFLIFINAVFISQVPAHANTVVEAETLGLKPDEKNDATASFEAALAYSRQHKINTLVLRKGQYHFYSENAKKFEYFISNTNNRQPQRKVPIHINGFDNFVLDGNGSMFIFHGNVTPLVLDQSSAIELKNISIDWERPFVSQMIVSAVNENSVELDIDRTRYPYEIRNKELWFVGEGWSYKAGVHLFVDENSNIEEGTLDEPMGETFFNNNAIELSTGKIRIHGTPVVAPKVGTRVVVRHGKGDNVGLFIYRSRDIKLSRLKIYHAPGKAILAQRCENVTVNESSVTINEQKERWFSSYADAMHFSGCKGNISVRHADNVGQMDDWFNAHGTYTTIEKREDSKTIIGRFNHFESSNLLIFGEGDEIAILDQHSGQSNYRSKVQSFELLPPNRYRLRVKDTLGEKVSAGNIAENLTWTPSIEISHSKVRKANRARGLLITTPKSVRIHDNYFSSAGTPILVEGDFYHWYESGAVLDMEIKNNIFDRTFTSGIIKAKTVDDDGGYYWGDASVVSITPTFKSKPDKPSAYHQNIRIIDNVITSISAPLIYARAVKNLSFRGNKVTIVDSPKQKRQPLFYFEASQGVVIDDNRLSKRGDLLIMYKDMPSDNVVKQKQFMLVEGLK